MEVINRNELRLRKNEIISRIKKGAIFIHPTDTIYGIGCSSLNAEAAEKIKKIKERKETHFFSVWVPSTKWIDQNCQHSPTLKRWSKELPGPYTLITKIKNKESIAPGIHNTKDQTLGVRMPDHWFHHFIAELGIPIVTTSANKTGESFMTSLEDLDPDIRKKVDFIIYEGEKKARPSKIVNIAEKESIRER